MKFREHTSPTELLSQLIGPHCDCSHGWARASELGVGRRGGFWLPSQGENPDSSGRDWDNARGRRMQAGRDRASREQPCLAGATWKQEKRVTMSTPALTSFLFRPLSFKSKVWTSVRFGSSISSSTYPLQSTLNVSSLNQNHWLLSRRCGTITKV